MIGAWRLLATVAGTVSLSSCGIYMHDSRLVPPAKVANDSLTSAATTQPFDAQLTHLAAFAAEEDSAVARYRVAQRDAQFARMIAGAFTDPDLAKVAGARMTTLAKDALYDPVLLGKIASADRNRSLLLEEKARFELGAATERRNYAEALAAAADPNAADLLAKAGCKDVRAAYDEAAAAQLAASAAPIASALGNLALQCHEASKKAKALSDLDAELAQAGGLIAALTTEVVAAEAQTDADLSDFSVELEAAIKKAEAAAKRADEQSLTQLRDDVGQVLTGAGQFARLAGWDRVETAIDKLLRAQVCSSESVEEETLAAAECDSVDPASTTGKVEASWAFVEALSKLLQSKDKDLRSVQWLLAAKAIVAAEKADAKLRAEAAAKQAAATRSRLASHLRELTYLRAASQSLLGTAKLSCVGTKSGCAFASYALAWNEGRIPGEILAYRPIQISREYSVRRARAAAERDRALALSGTSTLLAGAEGGIKPELLGQLLFDLSLLGVTIDGD